MGGLKSFRKELKVLKVTKTFWRGFMAKTV